MCISVKMMEKERMCVCMRESMREKNEREKERMFKKKIKIFCTIF